jgi:WD40 repeat protein
MMFRTRLKSVGGAVLSAVVVTMGMCLLVDRTVGAPPQDTRTAEPSPSASPASLKRAQIPAYELQAAGAGDPANVSPSLVAILGDSRLKMLGTVRSLVFTPDGKSLISAGNQEIAFWNPSTGEQQRVLRGHTDQVSALALSRDGGTLVSGGYDHLVKVWDLASGKNWLTLQGHLTAVFSVAISPDGKLIASGESQQIRLWDIADGRQHIHARRLEGHDQAVYALAFSPDGGTLASASAEGTINLWEVATGRQVKTLKVPQERWKVLAYSPDGRTLAAGGLDQGLVCWDTASWTIRHRTPPENPLAVTALAFSRDGQRLVVALGYAVRMIDVARGKELRTFEDQKAGIGAVALSPDDQTVAASCWMIKLWNADTGREKPLHLLGHRAGVESVAFSPDGALLATSSYDRTIKLWDLATRQERMTLQGHQSYVTSIAFRPDGRTLSSLGFDGELILWELPSGERLRSWTRFSGQELGFSPDGRWLTTLTRMRRGLMPIELWDMSNREFRVITGYGPGFIQFSPDSKKLIFAGQSREPPHKRRLVVWDIQQKQAERTIENGLLPDQLRLGALCPDGQTLALVGRTDDDHGKVRTVTLLWDLVDERPTYRLDQEATHLAFSPDGHTLLGIGRDGNAQVWDPRNGTLRETIRVCEAGRYAIRDVVFAPDSLHFAAALGNGTARIFRLQPAPQVVQPRAPLPIVSPRPEPPIDLWRRLLNKTAPELHPMKAWAGGPPVTLAGLRGKFILLHFWNTESVFQLVQLMLLHEQFGGQGLVIIVLQPDRGISPSDFLTEVGWWSRNALGGRPVPFRMALDDGGPTPIEGTDAKTLGATFAAYGILNRRQGSSLPVVNLIIGPDGKVLLGAERAGGMRSDLETVMGVKAKVPEWRRRFNAKYALTEGQLLKRIGPPYPPERLDYEFYSLGASYAGWRPDPNESFVFHWDGRLKSWGSSGVNYPVNRLHDVLSSVLGFRRTEFDGPAELLAMPVPGDWIIREGAAKVELLQALEPILTVELKKPVHFTAREVEREVIVARGRYQFHPLSDLPNERVVHLGTESLPPRNGPGGRGSLKQMLSVMGDRINCTIIDESESPGGLMIEWTDHLARQVKELSANTEDGRSLLHRLMENVSQQTSLTFHQEWRKVAVWSVTQDK